MAKSKVTNIGPGFPDGTEGTIKQEDKDLFKLLCDAVPHDKVVLISCKHKATGEYRNLICLLYEGGKEWGLHPVGLLFPADSDEAINPIIEYELPEGVKHIQLKGGENGEPGRPC